MLCVNRAQLLVVWSQRSSKPAPLSESGPNAGAATNPAFVKPLVPNGAVLKLIGGRSGANGTPGPLVLFSCAKAPKAVICPPKTCAAAGLNVGPGVMAALYWAKRALRTPSATLVAGIAGLPVLKQ